jgi:undecaprenyl diphosphate synthase
MTPSSLDEATQAARPGGLHVAMIMDGNGRWARARGLPRAVGHRQGAETVRRVVEAAPMLGVRTLTLYAFSSDNWRRPPREVASLMRLFRSYLRGEVRRLAGNGVRLAVIGRRDRLSDALRVSIDEAERDTAQGTTLDLRLAIDYSARDAIARAAGRWTADAEPTREDFARLLAAEYANGTPVPDVDLLIRTGGERRLSDFLLWECAYAELYFTDRMWPDFTAVDFAAAIDDFHARERRFGALPGEARRLAANY